MPTMRLIEDSPIRHRRDDNVAERYNQEEEEEKLLYRSENARLDSFQEWPPAYPVKKEALAKNGFYFLGPRDCVRCVFCFLVLEKFEPGDVVEVEHRKYSPRCPFLKVGGHLVGNIPLQANYKKQPDIRYQQYSNTSDRLKSFAEWPKAMRQKPKDLAAAGFFYKGRGDIVQCFCCGGIVKSWDADDDPWSEHKRHFPMCQFLKKNNPNHLSTPVKKDIKHIFRRRLSLEAEKKGYSKVLIEKYREERKKQKWLEPADINSFIEELEKFKVQPETQQSDPNQPITFGDEAGSYPPCQQCIDRCCGTFNCGHSVYCEDCGQDQVDCPECKTPVKTIHPTKFSFTDLQSLEKSCRVVKQSP